jgi:ADP-heptose:LPS heptosyltransferase
MFFLGAPIGEIPRAKLAARTAPGASTRAVLHPFASSLRKTWPAGRFLALARRFRDSGLQPAFIGSSVDDFSPFREFEIHAGAPLAEVKSLMAGAALFVGNDSGPAHIAAAFGVPSIVIFGASDPDIWGPWRAPSEVIAGRGDAALVELDRVFEALARMGVAA